MQVRSASCKALGALVTATAKAEGVPAWTKGMASVSYNLPPATRALLEKVVPILLEHFGEDDDKDTVAAASEALTDIINLLGPAAATPLATQLCEVAIALLSKGHACMQEEEEDAPGAEAEADEDVDDHDASLWEAVSDLLTTLPKVMGEYYLMHFAKLVPQLEPYLSAEHPAGDRSLAVGILAESLHQLELSGAGFLPMVSAWDAPPLPRMSPPPPPLMASLKGPPVDDENPCPSAECSLKSTPESIPKLPQRHGPAPPSLATP